MSPSCCAASLRRWRTPLDRIRAIGPLDLIPAPDKLRGAALSALDRAGAAAEQALGSARDVAEEAADTAFGAAANAFDVFVRGGVADLTPTPASIISEAPQATVYRYRMPKEGGRSGAAPVLLVPPLAAPARCFDLRRGSSLVQHLIAKGHPTYLVDYGRISFSDRELGLEHWVDEILPRTIEAVADDAGAPVQPLGWCLGGIMSLLAMAARPDLPVLSIATVASPFNFARVRMMAPIRPIAELIGGRLVTGIYRALGGAPAPVVRAGYQLAAIDKYLTKPYVLARNLHDREFLAQIEAVDEFTANMIAYPGRTLGQLYHRFFIINELAEGKLQLSDRMIDLADVRVPVLSVAGTGDSIAPRPAVHHLGELLPNSPRVVLKTAPGGHLGVLAGRSAVRTTWVYLDEFLRESNPETADGPVTAAA